MVINVQYASRRKWGRTQENLVKFTSLSLLLAILALSFIAAPASADTIAIANQSFETVALGSPLNLSCGPLCTFNVGPIPGWMTMGESGTFQPGPTLFASVPDGTKAAYTNGGSISQTLSATLSPDTTYTLTVDVGHRLDGFVTNYTIELLAGSMVLNSFSDSNGMITAGTFAPESVSYTTGAMPLMGNLGIELISNGIQTDFDNVTLSATPVPEPGTLALLATGLGLMFFIFRRR
jgi:PEP-CTERM motif